MSGLKSGSGDDLWDEEEADDPDEEAGDDEAEAAGADAPASQADTQPSTEPGSTASGSADGAEGSGSADVEPSGSGDRETPERPYIVRRAIRDKSVQFERDERLTFFVHRDVVDGERELANELESTLGRDVPKFDIREAAYRAALRNPDDVLDELLEMGYTVDEG